MMVDVSEFIKRAAERSGFDREKYSDKSLPTQPSNIVAIPMFGDLRSTFVFSSLLLANYKRTFNNKYIVLCSWPGFHGLFPYVDEYWSIHDESLVKGLAPGANNMYNTTSLAADLTRGLAEVLDVATARDFSKYYDRGFTKQYWETFGNVWRFLPDVPSSSRMSEDFRTQLTKREGAKVVIHPATRMRSWQGGKTVQLPVSKEFWRALIERLLAEGHVPVIWQNWFTYDMSRDFADKCLYLVPRDVTDVLAAMRAADCVLDVHTGMSRMAAAARCPYVAVTERKSYVEDAEYVIDDLCCQGVPRHYLFSFSTMLMTGGPDDWKLSVFDNVASKLREFIPTLDRGSLPATKESFGAVSYDRVREYKAKRLGANFIGRSKTSKET